MPTRLLRPALSPRYRVLESIRKRSLASQTTESRASLSRILQRSRRRTWIFLGVSLVLGAVTGSALRRNVVKPIGPEPGTAEDQALVAELAQKIDCEFKVKVLRGKCLGVAKQLKGQEGGWREIVTAQSESTLRTSLSGARGLGVERLFWNQSDDTLVAVIWFGPSTSGWPGVAHGGLIATQLLDKISLACTLSRGAYDEATEQIASLGDHAKTLLPSFELQDPEQLNISYVKPTFTEQFYVIRVAPRLPLALDPSNVVPEEPPHGQSQWHATLETMDGRALVKAKASIPTSGLAVERQLNRVADSAYDQFRRWMWPSRQASLQS